MKILHVLYSGLGGHGNVFFSMAEADEKKVHEFEALFNGVEEVKQEYIERCREKNIAWNFVKKKPGIDIGYYFKLYWQIKKGGPDVVFLHGGAALIPAKLAKITGRTIKKIIVRETQANHLKTKADWFYLATSMMAADKMVYLSTAYKEQVKTKLPFLYSEKRTVVIPNGINLQAFNDFKKQRDDKKILLGMQSRLIPIKDHITLINAFAILLKKNLKQQLLLMIAGEGEYKETLEKLAAVLNIADKVIFTGMLEEKELVSFLNNLDIYIHATLGETMSTALMQAMACAKPIIASDVPGINNMVENNVTGLLVPVQNADALAAAVLKLIDNPVLAGQLSANSLNIATTGFSNKTMLEKYNAILNN
jgi:L-malate glycosyltransferase